MKKIIIAILIAISIPISASAITPGYGADITCIPSNYPNANCGDNKDMFKRIYNLEVEVEQLRAKLEAQESIGGSQATNWTLPVSVLERLDLLEGRVRSLETIVEFIQHKVIATLEIAIGIFQKLIK